MQKRYPNLLSPLKVGNTVFRNRLFSAPQGLHALQGGEPYPTEAIIATFANKARGGAAMVTLSGCRYPVLPDGEHIAYDLEQAISRRYLAHLAEAVHFYGAKASMQVQGNSTRPEFRFHGGQVLKHDPVLEATEDVLDEVAENYAWQAGVLQDLGYDMVQVHMAYRNCLGGRFLSRAANKRTDKYGGSVANRARFPMMIFDRIKEKCGRDFLIEFRMSGTEPLPGGTTIRDLCRREGIKPSTYYAWLKDFMEAGEERLTRGISPATPPGLRSRNSSVIMPG